ncbi:hypothetical protein BU23DRAFT_570250 [Bimuria novae-zelandiae CBS 107.79]|uniref:Uncharacterized protein n=1 Tax=Bimuria novae-zelandiae CBS 107.79 TaxID=1447943 RepID=A0A6A5V2S9_9PLEO|nr:hypothetical protein BU23DRAFT_570250 [Bimuria novae-zelandiae CBS 107.79]
MKLTGHCSQQNPRRRLSDWKASREHFPLVLDIPSATNTVKECENRAARLSERIFSSRVTAKDSNEVLLLGKGCGKNGNMDTLPDIMITTENLQLRTVSYLGQAQICHSSTGNLLLDTGPLDRFVDLSLNHEPRFKLQFKRVTVMRRRGSRVPIGGGLVLLPHLIKRLLPQQYHKYVM